MEIRSAGPTCSILTGHRLRNQQSLFKVLLTHPKYTINYFTEACGSVVVKALYYYSDDPGIDSRWCHWIFQWHISFRPYHGHGVDSAPSGNEYQENFLGVNAAGAWGWRPHHFHVPNVIEIWEYKPPGTLWATPSLLRDPFCKLFYVRCSNSGPPTSVRSDFSEWTANKYLHELHVIFISFNSIQDVPLCFKPHDKANSFVPSKTQQQHMILTLY
jgi:hypothetical protein